ncbi:MAG: HAD family hydrolase [Actinobacteria bacterium]|nr:HAD family hydrolase [Actinomycetota bacterium]
MRAPAAVLFDLWGTLVPAIPPSERDAVSREMAVDLGVDGTAFAAAYRDSYRERFLGVTGSLEETVRALAEACGGAPTVAAVTAAAARRLDLTRRLLESDDPTLAVLDGLLDAGLPLALVSDSSVETPSLWPESPLSERIWVTAFSCLLGVRKPDPAVYLHAARELDVGPTDCLFVGDGDGRELSGAADLGMQVVRLRVPGDDPSARYDDDRSFTGPTITALNDLLKMPWLRRAK